MYFNFKLLAALRNDKEFDTNDLENNYRFVFIKKKQASAILLHIYDDIRDIKFITLYSIACVSRCHDRYKNHALIFNKWYNRLYEAFAFKFVSYRRYIGILVFYYL